jgi:hypothetical protein
MTDDFKLTLLKNAVQDASHLASVELAYDVTTRLGSGAPGAIDYNGYIEVLLSAAQNHDAKISPTTARSHTRHANTHLSFPTESYDEEQYNIDTSIDTIWVNARNSVLAHYSNGTRVSDNAWSKLPQDSRNIWMSLPIDDRKLILGASNSVSSLTKTSSSAPSRSGLGCGRQTFARNRDKRKVMFMDRQSDDATTSTEPTIDSTNDDLVNNLMGQYDVDFDTLCIHVAERKQEELKAEGKHPHHRPMKQTANPVVAPPDIWVNARNSVLAHYSNGTQVSDNAWSKFLPDSQNIWMSLPIDDRKLILGASDSVSSLTETSSSAPPRSGLGCGRQTFARNRDKRKVMFMDRQSDDATTSTEPTIDSTDDDLVDDIMGQFDVDFDTLCIHVAERQQEELKAEGKHPHHRPMKQMANPVVAPPGDVRRLLGNKVKTIGGTPYEVKRAGTTPALMDVDSDGIVYSVKMVDCVYRVSTNNHSEATGALIDRGADGGIAGNDC